MGARITYLSVCKDSSAEPLIFLAFMAPTFGEGYKKHNLDTTLQLKYCTRTRMYVWSLALPHFLEG